MDQDDLHTPRKYEIWPSWKLMVMLSVMESQFPDPQFNNAFRLGSKRFNSAHVLTALLNGKPIFAL